MSRIKNLIFDFGSVLLDLAPERCKAAFRALGFVEIDDLLSMAHQKGVLEQLELGLVSPEQFCDELRLLMAEGRSRRLSESSPLVSDALPLPTNDAIFAAWYEMADGIPAYRLEYIDHLRRQGYHVAALSNTNIPHWEYCRPLFETAGYPSVSLFEHVWLSCDLHLVKPDPAIFARILDLSGYHPAETLFVDDSTRNCEVAATFGIHTYAPEARTDWRSHIDALLHSSGK